MTLLTALKQRRWRARNRVSPTCALCGSFCPKHAIKFCSKECHRKVRQHREHVEAYLFRRYKESIGCQKCGYDSCGASLDFHHKDPTTKARRISKGLWGAGGKLFKEELAKCILFCKNCHYEKEFDKGACS